MNYLVTNEGIAFVYDGDLQHMREGLSTARLWLADDAGDIERTQFWGRAVYMPDGILAIKDTRGDILCELRGPVGPMRLRVVQIRTEDGYQYDVVCEANFEGVVPVHARYGEEQWPHTQ